MLMRKRTHPWFTELDLAKLDEAIVRFDHHAQQLLLPFQKSAFCTPKWHELTHITRDIRQCGCLDEYTTDPYEAHHKDTKKMLRCSCLICMQLAECPGYCQFAAPTYPTPSTPDS